MKIIALFLLLVLSGCASGENYEGLKVVDGNGRVLIIHHALCDTYTIQNVTKTSPTSLANTKLDIAIIKTLKDDK